MIDTVLFFGICYGVLFRHRSKEISELGLREFKFLQVANICCVLIFAYVLCESFYTVEWPCFNVNDCVVWLLSWNHVTIAVLVLISASTHRRTKTFGCFNEASKLAKKCLNLYTKSVLSVFCYYSISMVVFATKTLITMRNRDTHVMIFLMYSLSYLIPLSMECVVICLCAIIRDTCRKINEILETLSSREYNNIVLAWNLKNLMKIHQNASNVLKIITKCFDKDLLIDLTFNMVWFIVYIYLIIVSLWKFKTYSDKFWKVHSVILEVLFLTMRVCYLSYSVNCIEAETQRMQIQLRNFQQSKKLNTVCAGMANKFVFQIMDNEMKMQVCGCFSIDSSFMRGIIGLATTYLVVFIQYGLGEPSKNSTNTTATP